MSGQERLNHPKCVYFINTMKYYETLKKYLYSFAPL